MTPSIPDTNATVNGCDPAKVNPPGPWGMCLVGLPHFQCCSAGEVVWSGVVAGALVDIKGAVPIDPKTSAPQSSAVLLLGPGSWRTEIPVAPSGAFDQGVTFPAAGNYQIGVLYQGAPADLDAFQVAWQYKVLQGATLASLFPSQGDWPSNDIMLATQTGAASSWEIELENAQGVPQPGAALTANGPVANSDGVVTLTYPAPDQFGPPGEIAAGLYMQSYSDIRPQDATLVGFPAWPHPAPLPTSAPFSVTQNGASYYDVADFFSRVFNGFTAAGPGLPPDYNPASGVLSLFEPNRYALVRLLTASGAVQTGRVIEPGNSTTWSTVGSVQPMVENGQVYLTLQDMTTVAKAIAWAAPDGHAGVLFSDSWLP